MEGMRFRPLFQGQRKAMPFAAYGLEWFPELFGLFLFFPGTGFAVSTAIDFAFFAPDIALAHWLASFVSQLF